eukprot:771091-Pelagomonas_calceolata.AAC.6
MPVCTKAQRVTKAHRCEAVHNLPRALPTYVHKGTKAQWHACTEGHRRLTGVRGASCVLRVRVHNGTKAQWHAHTEGYRRLTGVRRASRAPPAHVHKGRKAQRHKYIEGHVLTGVRLAKLGTTCPCAQRHEGTEAQIHRRTCAHRCETCQPCTTCPCAQRYEGTEAQIHRTRAHRCEACQVVHHLPMCTMARRHSSTKAPRHRRTQSHKCKACQLCDASSSTIAEERMLCASRMIRISICARCAQDVHKLHLFGVSFTLAKLIRTTPCSRQHGFLFDQKQPPASNPCRAVNGSSHWCCIDLCSRAKANAAAVMLSISAVA